MIKSRVSHAGVVSPPPTRRPSLRKSRLAALCLAFVGLTVFAGAAVLPTIAGLLGLHLSERDGAEIALLAWVPSALYVGARCVGLLRGRLQRARLSSSAVARESL